MFLDAPDTYYNLVIAWGVAYFSFVLEAESFFECFDICTVDNQWKSFDG